MSGADYVLICSALRLRSLDPRVSAGEQFEAFVRYLGARELTVDEALQFCMESAPSMPLAAALAAQVAALSVLNRMPAGTAEARLWYVNGIPLTAAELRIGSPSLDEKFRDLAAELGASEPNLRSVIEHLSGADVAEAVIPAQASWTRIPSSVHDGSHVPQVRPPLALRRWRSAEQQVAVLLEYKGFKVDDVSRQNMGYDLEAQPPDGDAVRYVEVKSLGGAGVPFTLTSNEEAMARAKGPSYWIALVCEVGDRLEVSFIRDPASVLNLSRQCRQWVWECAAYPYEPELFELG